MKLKNQTIIPKSALFKFLLFIAVICSITKKSSAQCGPVTSANCMAYPSSELLLAGQPNVDFRYETFADYTAGRTQSGSTILRLKVDANNVSCKWALRVYVENNPGAGTPADQWESNQIYGSGSDVPTLDLLQIKIYNSCNTPINSGIYQNFPAVNGGYIDIINDIALNAAGSCITNVNGPGNYLTNYNEYTFIIDYRVVPGLNFTPGVYQLNLHFCLVEQI